MQSLLLLAGAAALVAWLCTPVVCALCRRTGLLDQPDRSRKVHRQPVPRLGGLVLAVAYLASFGLLMLLPSSGGALVRGHLASVFSLAPAALVVLTVGLLDDLYGLTPAFRLTYETVAALLAVSAGVSIGDAWWSVPVTVVWLVATANAFNLIDGVDGLAAGIGLFATVTILGAALLNGNHMLALATAPLAGALAGFLRYNFEPASIFLGDGGALTVGFLLGCFAVVWGYKSTTAVGMAAPLILLFLPFLDVALSIARRFLNGKPIFGADRGHIHHRLLALGFRPRHVALTAYAACGLAALVSLVQSSAPPLYGALVVTAFAALVWIALSRLGYREFRASYRAVWSGEVRRVFRHEILLDQLRADLAAANSVEECWDKLCEASRVLGLSQVLLRMGEHHLRADLHTAAHDETFQTSVPLPGGGRVEFTGRHGDPATAQLLLPIAGVLRQAIEERRLS